MERTLKATNPRKLMNEHLEVLKGYADHVVARGGNLADHDERDKSQRMTEYIAIGRSFKLTHTELVSQIFGDMLKAKRSPCECPTCRGRAGGPDHAAV